MGGVERNEVVLLPHPKCVYFSHCMATAQGYQCEFVEVVPEDLYCRKCSLVARRLTITDCCGENFCHNCIAGPQQQNQPCPACGENNFNTFKQVKNQRRIIQLMVFCSMKERGCGWSGTLEQLDTHLDPHQDNCQYVDTECPLNCLKTIPKNNLDDHLAQHCVKRAYVCRYCSFKATYEEVVDTHLPQCKYVPLDCPNRCGATFERDFFEDHMKMCRLEEVECELRGVGCGGRFLREDQEEHARQNSQKHLTLTASLAMDTKEQLQQKLLELDQRHKEEEGKLKKKMEKQEERLDKQKTMLGKQEKKLCEQEQKLGEQKKKLGEQEKKLGEQEKTLGEQEKDIRSHKKEFQELTTSFLEFKREVSTALLHYTFKMRNFSAEKKKNKPSDWKSPVMYTHVGGYKFCVGVDANGYGRGRGKSIYVDLWAMPGEFDDQLKWPAKAKFTIELVNQQGGENASHTVELRWSHPITKYKGLGSVADYCRIPSGFVEHAELVNYLKNDTLYFYVSHVEF